MVENKSNKTFFGFWPANDNYSNVDSVILDDSLLASKETQKILQGTFLEKETIDWQIIVCNDYMVLLHIKHLEPTLADERDFNQDSDISMLKFSATRNARRIYLEGLNALNFILFCSCFTGRNDYFLDDFSEVSIWQSLRVMYTKKNTPIRSMQFGRGTKKEMIRRGEYKITREIGNFKFKIETFKDMIYYWEILYEQNLINLAALGTKIISEHRLQNYNLAVILIWFEIEKWIIKWANDLSIPINHVDNHGTASPLEIKKILKNFKQREGTTIAGIYDELDDIRKLRNKIAHEGKLASHKESSKAIELFMTMFNLRSGLTTRVAFDLPTFHSF